MNITIIAAMGKNREIGAKNTLLWNLPEDMKHFRSRTKGSSVIMGRKTFLSIGRPLPNRQNIILSRDPSFCAEEVVCVSSFSDALQHAQQEGKNSITPTSECFIIGGAEIYALALPFATHLSLTHIDACFADADAFFPEYNISDWKEQSRRHIQTDEKNMFCCDIIEYERM